MFCPADDETEKSEVFVNSWSLVCVISLALVYHSYQLQAAAGIG
jgi:hypothetical protein